MEPKMRFAGKVVLVTGAAAGIGRATARRLAAEGARVFAADLDAAGLAEMVAECPKGGVESHHLDVKDAAACRQAVARCVERHGRLDVLCNVAGVMHWSHFTEIREEDWNRLLAVNLSGVFFLCQAAIPHLLETRGVIVNMASAAALKGQAYTAPYAATKAAVASLTKSLAVEYAKRGLRAVALAPGGVKTALTAATRFPEGYDPKLVQKLMPLMEMAEPDEIAAAVAWLASDEARYVNGAVLAIDGAQTAG
jgi:meso-butanediol dehydrogenase/(S,S)-butanediol dehydrogenase/diacetyl reductase